MTDEQVIVTEKAMRRSTGVRQCRHCMQPVGRQHAEYCRLICKTVVLRADIEVRVPANWTPDVIKDLKNKDRDQVLRGVVPHFEYLRDIPNSKRVDEEVKWQFSMSDFDFIRKYAL